MILTARRGTVADIRSLPYQAAAAVVLTATGGISAAESMMGKPKTEARGVEASCCRAVTGVASEVSCRLLSAENSGTSSRKAMHCQTTAADMVET